MKFQKRKMILIVTVILTLINLVYELQFFQNLIDGEVLNVQTLNFSLYE